MPYSKATLNDEQHISLLLAQAQRSITLKSDESYKCSWLTSGGIGSKVWETTDPGNSKKRTINFDVSLIDGSKLGDPENFLSLVSIQKLAYHIRMGKLTTRPIAPKRWQHYINFSVSLLNRLLLNESHFQTKDNGFMLLTKNDCIEFMKDFSEGGWTSALEHKERLISYLHSKLKCTLPLNILLNDPHNLDQSFVDDAKDWFQRNGLIITTTLKGKTSHTISRVFLNSTFNIPQTGVSDSLAAFINQFEPTPRSKTTPANKHRQHPSQNQPLTHELKHESIGAKHFNATTTMLKCVLQGHKVLPELFPQIEISERELYSEFSDNIQLSGHTNLIPLSIGLDALNQAVKWILHFGPAIIQMTVELAKKSTELKKNSSPKHRGAKLTRHFLSLNKSIFCVDPKTQQTASLKDAIDMKKLPYHSGRKNDVSANDFKSIIEAFVGACALVISILKPIRDTELHNLRRDCLDKEDTSGGVLLQHEQLKAGALGINPQISQAIPSITARAIQLLQLMGGQLAEIFDDNSEGSTLLFYYPSKGYGVPSNKSMSYKVNMCLDKFCDIIETPKDEFGRRWYIRVHEMRKFFLFVMHRHEGDKITEILRRAAGHSDRKHIYSYIAEEDVDYDVVRFTSECVEDRLVALSKHQVNKESNQGLFALYHYACEHFGVSSISGMKYDQLIGLLSQMRLTGRYEISTYIVKLKGYSSEVISLGVAIKFGEIKDEKFKQ
ncbi:MULTISPECIES: hypothetical protein [Pseudomonas]|uniref:Uncharacterized protein n=2 Tax=Pseudomonas TaxID=286 RepID=A0A8T8LZM2_PSESX|nr:MULTISPECIES: hypothetical protein [Pseudomonas]MEE4667161.1 hypothetical protein [Pseudomonas alliivorans]MBF7141955.1 hypothetical protein [Pseudomonas sp. LY10J]NJP00493.1 hypothetical protein [Pseudomonas quercus]PBP51586.1 hypothetical protein CCL18_26340 [Pseudomonas syringae]QUP66646.1 hypothetical protein PSYCIT7_002975 [Pseudomonas syringae Cit 7]